MELQHTSGIAQQLVQQQRVFTNALHRLDEQIIEVRAATHRVRERVLKKALEFGIGAQPDER